MSNMYEKIGRSTPANLFIEYTLALYANMILPARIALMITRNPCDATWALTEDLINLEIRANKIKTLSRSVSSKSDFFIFEEFHESTENWD